MHEAQPRQLTPPKPLRNRNIGGTLAPDSRDLGYLAEAGIDVMYDREIMPARRDWNDGMPLADFECSHGSLPNDSAIDCNCWR